MNDLNTAQRESFVDLLLEEHFDDRHAATDEALPARAELPPTPPPAPRQPPRLQVAAALLLGSAVVLAFAFGVGRGTASHEAQDPADKSLHARSFFPLGLGDRWTYRQTIGDDVQIVTVECTAANEIDGRRIAQLATVDDRGIEFSFWSVDDRGVHRHANNSRAFDPVLKEIPASAACELPSPVGAHPTWQLRRVPPRPDRGFGGARSGRVRAHTIDEARLLRAELRGVHRELVLGDREWRTLEVHYRDDDGGTEVRHFARGVGLVQEQVTLPGGQTRERTLVRFDRAVPSPDRTTVLGTVVPIDAAKRARWLDKPTDEEVAWTMRSEFAVVETGGQSRTFRIFGSRATPFDAEDVDDFAKLAKDEGWSARMHGLVPQRVAMATAQLRCLLPALVERRRLTMMSSTIRLDAQGVYGQLTLADVTTGDPITASVTIVAGIPTAIEVE